MSIRKKYVIPECYVQKEAYCDNCQEKLVDTGIRLMSYPSQIQMKCPKCNKTYSINENDLKGEWKWRTI